MDLNVSASSLFNSAICLRIIIASHFQLQSRDRHVFDSRLSPFSLATRTIPNSNWRPADLNLRLDGYRDLRARSPDSGNTV